VIDGLVVIDKPTGMTSHDVVGRCRRIFGQRRVGHAGTLDPDATGVLLVGLGQATRLLQFLSGLGKSYEGEIVLGVATTTLDASGAPTGTWDMTSVTLDRARQAAVALTGDIEQVPPMVSAISIGGRRLHELAREGIEVDRPPRAVTVSRFDLEMAEDQDPGRPGSQDPGRPGSQDPGRPGSGPVLAASVDCSSGTYIRTLAADLGARLGGGAHLRRLRRTAVGAWTLDDAVSLDQAGPDHVVPPAAVLRDLPAVTVDPRVADEIRHGKVLDPDHLGATGSGPWPVLGPEGDLLAVYREHGPGRVKPVVVLSPTGR
jgi:tRNA pseudouridine55 synthase